ncbi:MAG: hypothetical protein ACREJN_11075 [Nitrospiraceae bacterium]
MTRRIVIAWTLVFIGLPVLGVGAPASAAVRIDAGAELQADAETVRHIEDVFNRAEDAIKEKDLDALMTVYSVHYRYNNLTKADMRTIWKEFFEHYDRIATLHSFSRIMVTLGTPPTADLTCTGALWATVDQTDQRVNLSIWAGDIHHLIYEEGAWKILGQRRNAPNRPDVTQSPPPLF